MMDHHSEPQTRVKKTIKKKYPSKLWKRNLLLPGGDLRRTQGSKHVGGTCRRREGGARTTRWASRGGGLRIARGGAPATNENPLQVFCLAWWASVMQVLRICSFTRLIFPLVPRVFPRIFGFNFKYQEAVFFLSSFLWHLCRGKL